VHLFYVSARFRKFHPNCRNEQWTTTLTAQDLTHRFGSDKATLCDSDNGSETAPRLEQICAEPFLPLAQPNVAVNNEDLWNAMKRLQDFLDAWQFTSIEGSGFVRHYLINGPDNTLFRLRRPPRWEHNARRSSSRVCIVNVKASHRHAD
jgi:hypothetical protein